MRLSVSATAREGVKERDFFSNDFSSQNKDIHALCAVVFESLILYSHKIMVTGRVFICDSHL